jgi:hypothetical protein
MKRSKSSKSRTKIQSNNLKNKWRNAEKQNIVKKYKELNKKLSQPYKEVFANISYKDIRDSLFYPRINFRNKPKCIEIYKSKPTLRSNTKISIK